MGFSEGQTLASSATYLPLPSDHVAEVARVWPT